jgi:hypothetical protein
LGFLRTLFRGRLEVYLDPLTATHSPMRIDAENAADAHLPLAQETQNRGPR